MIATPARRWGSSSSPALIAAYVITVSSACWSCDLPGTVGVETSAAVVAAAGAEPRPRSANSSPCLTVSCASGCAIERCEASLARNSRSEWEVVASAAHTPTASSYASWRIAGSVILRDSSSSVVRCITTRWNTASSTPPICSIVVRSFSRSVSVCTPSTNAAIRQIAATDSRSRVVMGSGLLREFLGERPSRFRGTVRTVPRVTPRARPARTRRRARHQSGAVLRPGALPVHG